MTRFERVFARFASRAAYAILAFSFVAAVLWGLSLRIDAKGFSWTGSVGAEDRDATAGYLAIAVASFALSSAYFHLKDA
ncbi:MAG: hypothetical protein JRN23_05680 [Nitrososphaerota archaeon]|nr:hypothetical protein [Nitrososphaerota archaeon]